MTTPTGASNLALWLLVLLPGVVGAGLVLGGRRAERLAVPVAVITAAAGLGLAVLVALARPAVTAPFLAGMPFALAVDALAALVIVPVAAVTLLVLVFSAGDITASRARFFGLMLLFAAAVAVTVTATTLPALLLAWEVMGATSYGLIGFWWRDEARVSGGTTAFITTRLADLGLYAAGAAALAGGSGLALADLPEASAGWRDVLAAGILLAALGKAAQLPFSFWLSQAMEGPSPVSALLHSAAMVAMGGYLLLRTAPLLEASGWAAPAAAWIGALTALLLGAVAVAQRDLKQLLAASTGAQLGFVVLAAGVSATAGGAAHLVAHAATKALLFLAAGAWLTALGTKQLAALRGVGGRWPVVGVTATIGALSLAGIPPLALWATKDAVLTVALEESPALYAVGLAAAALSAAYAGKVLVVLWRDRPGNPEAGFDAEQPGTRHVGALEQAPMVVLAVGAAVLGLLALPPVAGTLRPALEGEGGHGVAVLELAVSALLAVAVLVVVSRRPLPAPWWAENWLGLEAAADLLVVRPVLRAADILARFDDQILDRGVDAVGVGTAGLARRAAAVDRGVVDAGVEAVARRVRRLGDLARRPQTGQLHQYYLQIAAVLAVGIVLLALGR